MHAGLPVPPAEARPCRARRRQKLGDRIQEALGVVQVAELRSVTLYAAAKHFGPGVASFLTALPWGGPDEAVRERGPPKSLLCERSFTGVSGDKGISEVVAPLVAQLWPRLVQARTPAGWARGCCRAARPWHGGAQLGTSGCLTGCSCVSAAVACAGGVAGCVAALNRAGWQDAAEHARLPAKLQLSWRQGYTPPRSRSSGLPPQLAGALLAHLGAVYPTCPLVAGRQADGTLLRRHGAPHNRLHPLAASAARPGLLAACRCRAACWQAASCTPTVLEHVCRRTCSAGSSGGAAAAQCSTGYVRGPAAASGGCASL